MSALSQDRASASKSRAKSICIKVPESLAPMWGQRESVPDTMHRRDGYARGSRHRASAPMRCIGRQRLQCLGHHLGDFLVSDLARCAAARLVIETIETPFGKPLSPES